MLTEHGILAEIASFPSGRSALIRKIVDRLTVPPDVALSFLAMHTKDSLEKKFAEAFAQTVDEALGEWQEKLIKAIGTLVHYHALPHKIYVTVDDDIAAYFLSALKKPLPQELMVGQNPPEIIILSASELRSYVKIAGIANPDPFIALESVFLEKLVYSD